MLKNTIMWGEVLRGEYKHGRESHMEKKRGFGCELRVQM